MSSSRGENALVSYPDSILYGFFNVSDDPWVPPGAIQPAQSLALSRSSTNAFYTGLPGFQNFRSPPVPSDCDTAQDSGYGGSHSTIYSALESVTSVNENDGYTEGGFHDPQATDHSLNIGSLNISPTATSIYKTPVVPSRPAANAKLLHCNACGVNVKTKSELKKHNHRHNRPYKCDYNNCPKAIRGFSTTNDLSRHKRTVHREHDSNVPTFICRHEPCTLKKEKLWPRADNFRSHLTRAHSITLKADEDLREYRYYPITTGPHEFRDENFLIANIRSESRSAPPPRATPYISRRRDCFQGKETGWSTTDSLQDFSARIHGRDADDFGHHRDQPDEAELHALRGVGSLVADVDPESRPTQVQDSPDLRSSQLPTGALSQLQKESPKQNHLLLTRSGCDSQLAPSNTLDGLKLPSAFGPQSLVSDVVAGTPVHEGSLGESMAALTDDEPAQEGFDHDEGIPIEGEDEVLDHHDPLVVETMSLDSSNQSKDGATTQGGLPELQETDNGLGNDFRASTKGPTLSPDTAERLKSILSDKDGLHEVLSVLKTIPQHLLEKALKQKEQQPQQNEVAAPNDQTGSPKISLRCKKCHKPFSRACELRKHMKRHEKPYGCTYKTCHKMFGSKNDWKRHESSQHFQMESWNCDYRGCDKVLPRRELFKTHLQHDHQEKDGQIIENKLESCRLGRHCDPRFWCGFCDQFIEIKEKVVNSWTKRCDHIDNHLFGKDGLAKKTMADWCYLEDKLAEGDAESGKKPMAAGPLSRSVKKRKATGDLDVRSTKRSNVLWICCECNHSENYHVSSQCMNCCHKLCHHCKMEQLPDFEHETDLMSQEEER